MAKHPGGSGRGNKGVTVHDDPTRPDCPDCNGFMKSSGKDWKCTECNRCVQKVKMDTSIESYNKSLGFDPIHAEEHAQKCAKGKTLILSSAQNNTPVFQKALKSLKQYAKHLKCEIAVIPSHYRNTTLYKKEDIKEFDPSIVKYLVKGEIEFGNVLIKSDVRIQPTTINPLAGKQSHGGRHWNVFGHPQLCRMPIPTAGEQFPKLLLTTGSITEHNYTVSDAGEKAKFHHCFAAIIIEKYNDEFSFVRQLSFDDRGWFYDLDTRVTPQGVTKGHRVEAITPGDEHVKFNTCEEAIYGKKGIVQLLKPRYIVRHDVLDGYAGSHHHLKDPMVQFLKHHSGDNDYRKELDEVASFLNRTTPEFSESVIVPSNHHDHLKKFLDTADANKDHTNALFILEMQSKMRERALEGRNYDPLPLYLEDKITARIRFLSRNEPFYIGPENNQVDHSQHGDVGANGARGSPAQFAKLPDRITAGHTHQAIMLQGYCSCGVSTGRLEYARGYSSWSNTVVVQYWGGKRMLLDIYNGKFRA